jgi:Putative peptidoglycan binding domain
LSTTHVVRQGECLSSIASENGFSDYRTIYDHPDNADFKQKRPNPDLIYPGDEIAIPDKTPSAHECQTGADHRFTIPRVRALVRVAVLETDDQPLADTPYALRFGDQVLEGRTDDDGVLEQPVPATIEKATLALTDLDVEVELQFGELDPIDEATGVQARLNNLGFWCGEVDGKVGPKTKAALSAFQASRALEPSGELDDTTRERLSASHEGDA